MDTAQRRERRTIHDKATAASTVISRFDSTCFPGASPKITIVRSPKPHKEDTIIINDLLARSERFELPTLRFEV